MGTVARFVPSVARDRQAVACGTSLGSGWAIRSGMAYRLGPEAAVRQM